MQNQVQKTNLKSQTGKVLFILKKQQVFRLISKNFLVNTFKLKAEYESTVSPAGKKPIGGIIQKKRMMDILLNSSE